MLLYGYRTVTQQLHKSYMLVTNRVKTLQKSYRTVTQELQNGYKELQNGYTPMNSEPKQK